MILSIYLRLNLKSKMADMIIYTKMVLKKVIIY